MAFITANDRLGWYSGGKARRAAATISGELSMPTTLPCGTRAARAALTLPSPLPISSTDSSPRNASFSISSRAHSAWAAECRA
jgi:hypothetical protein